MGQGTGLVAAVRTLDPKSAKERLEDKSDTAIAELLARMHIGYAVEILEEFEPERRQRIAAATPFGQGQLWLQGHSYPEGTVGRLMERPPAVFAPSITVAEVVEQLREIVRLRMVIYVFVIEPDGRLIGVVAFRELVFADPRQTLADIMLREPFWLRPEQPLVDAMREVVKRHYPVYPVCDEGGRLLGLVKGQSLFEQQAFEISAQAGAMVGVEKEERLATPWPRSLKFRHPWLQLNLVTAFAAAAVVGAFQSTLDQLVLLAVFLPVLAGQSGNTGCQALAVALRGITLGELEPGQSRRVISKEALLGFLNGALVGTTAGIGMFIFATTQGNPDRLLLAVAVLCAMIGSCTVSGIAGATIPLVLRRLGADPATASSIFLTTATDVVSMGLFLSLATVLVL
jgi:magnesium transporter